MPPHETRSRAATDARRPAPRDAVASLREVLAQSGAGVRPVGRPLGRRHVERQAAPYSTLNPGQIAPVQYNFNSNQIELVGRARKHEISLYLYGEAKFRDAFGTARSAPFCYRYVPESPDKDWPLCPEHNSPTAD